MPPPAKNNQALPTKEHSTFKKIFKCYEQKQYKAGLRYAKQLLSTFPNHGETLAMRGLILNCMGKHEEAMEVVRKGLTCNLESHICWHVFGLVQRSDKKYDEAMKAYKRALKLEPDNMQILRDLSLLQIQMRDLEGYKDSRHQILVLRPTNKMSWIAYATAYHLLGDYDMALNVIKEFKRNNKPTSQHDNDTSELVLYEVMILAEAGRPEDALRRLEENAAFIIDRAAYMENRVKLLLALERRSEAETALWQLIERNPENMAYYEDLMRCRDESFTLADSISSLTLQSKGAAQQSAVAIQQKEMLSIFSTALEVKPRASIPKLMVVILEPDEELFEEKAIDYLVALLRKGAPSLFKNFALLYDTPSYSNRVALIEKHMLDFIRRTEEDGYDKASLDGSELPECPTTVLWVYYYLAQHFERLKNYPKAHKYIDDALKHTPTLIELYMAKAKIYKHEGDAASAATFMEQAQELDTADRYINSKCAKYMLRAGMVAEAEAMCARFTREGVNASESLNEMQCMWYELECARAFARLGKYGDALKKCHQIERHFIAFYEDQYDFHSYCVRKMTLCAYVKTLRFEDTIRDHKFYIEAAKLAASIYVRMVEHPEDFSDRPQEAQGNLSAAELKKQKRKANKAKAVEEKTKQQAAAQPVLNQPAVKRRIDGELDVVEPEPLDPQKLLKTENPIDEAAKILQPLLEVPCKDIGALLLAFSVYSHKKKILVMLQCLLKAITVDPHHPDVKEACQRYIQKVASSNPDGLVGELAKEGVRLATVTCTKGGQQ